MNKLPKECVGVTIAIIDSNEKSASMYCRLKNGVIDTSYKDLECVEDGFACDDEHLRDFISDAHGAFSFLNPDVVNLDSYKRDKELREQRSLNPQYESIPNAVLDDLKDSYCEILIGRNNWIGVKDSGQIFEITITSYGDQEYGFTEMIPAKMR